MNRYDFSQLLSEKTGVPVNNYEQLFTAIENKYDISIEDYILNIENYIASVESQIPNTFGQKSSVTQNDAIMAQEFGVNDDTIAGLRNFAATMQESVQNMNSGIDLSELSDKQKTYLTQLSYLDLNEEGKEILKNGGSIKVSELEQYLASPDDQFCGNIAILEGVSKAGTDAIVGEGFVITERELLYEIQKAGLGEITINHMVEDKFSGFQAMAFSDTEGNTGISYRGSDFNYDSGGLSDWAIGDLGEYLCDNGIQQLQAVRFFEKYSDKDGNNYVYGHSLGGNLTSHTFLKHFNEIQEAFTIDGTPINSKLLKTQEQIDAFNSDKYNCNIVAGDIVGNLKSHEGYEDNINYIANNGYLNNNFIGAHLVQSATYDENGNFVTVTREDALEKMGDCEKLFVDISQSVRSELNNFESSKVGQWITGIVEGIKELGDNVKSLGQEKPDAVDLSTENSTEHEAPEM